MVRLPVPATTSRLPAPVVVPLPPAAGLEDVAEDPDDAAARALAGETDARSGLGGHDE